MKKLAAMFIAFTVLCSFSACSNNTNNEETSSAALENEASNVASAEDTIDIRIASQLSGAGSESPQTGVKSLVVYFFVVRQYRTCCTSNSNANRF